MGMRMLPDQEAIEAECDELNPDDKCAANSCCCELSMINEILALLWDQVIYDNQFLHELGWSYEENCQGAAPTPNPTPNPNVPGPGTGSGGGVSKECCGAYPSRKPYVMENGQDCCSNTVF